MPPAAAIGAGAVIGAIPGIVGAATGAGKSKYAAPNYSESKEYDPNAFKYGGDPGTADEMAHRFGGADAGYGAKAQDLYTRGMENTDAARTAFQDAGYDAAQAQQSRGLQLESRGLNLGSRDLALQSRGLGLEARGRQGAVQNMMMDRAMGNNLITDREAALARNDLTARMRSGVASARGPAGLANAQSDAMAAEAQGLGQINSQAGINAAREQQANEQAAFGAASGMREGDASMQQGDLGIRRGDTDLQSSDAGIRSGDQAGQALGIQQGQAWGNLGTTMLGQGANYGNLGQGYAGLEKGVRDSSTNAGISGQNTLATSQRQQVQVDSGTQEHNADTDVGYLKMVMGGVAGGAQMGMQGSGVGVPAKAEGGPVQGGRPYLVGEKGPEIIVPPSDGVVIPNKALGEDYGFRTAQASMDKALAIKAEEGRNLPKTFHRDTPEEQKQTGDEYYADLMRQADAIIAQLQKAKGRGPSVAVARDEGDVDEPPQWLAKYMAEQQAGTPAKLAMAGGGMSDHMKYDTWKPGLQAIPEGVADKGPSMDDYYLARREEGGPVQAGQPTLVGEKGPEVVVAKPETAATTTLPVAPEVHKADDAMGLAHPGIGVLLGEAIKSRAVPYLKAKYAEALAAPAPSPEKTASDESYQGALAGVTGYQHMLAGSHPGLALLDALRTAYHVGRASSPDLSIKKRGQ